MLNCDVNGIIDDTEAETCTGEVKGIQRGEMR